MPAVTLRNVASVTEACACFLHAFSALGTWTLFLALVSGSHLLGIRRLGSTEMLIFLGDSIQSVSAFSLGQWGNFQVFLRACGPRIRDERSSPSP